MSMDEKLFKDISKKYLSFFNEAWEQMLNQLFFKQIQFIQGNRLRPFIFFGAYLYEKDSIDISEEDYSYAANISVCIELIHKASLVLDDYIDQDTSRHGNKTFHEEYGSENAMMFALNVVGNSVRRLYNLATSNKENHYFNSKGFPLFLDLICDMSMGELLELNLQGQEKFNKDVIRNIID